MKSLNSVIDFTPPAKKAHAPRSQKEELIENFRTRLNENRVGTKYKPLSHVAVKVKLGNTGMTDHELYAFYQECCSAKSFSKFFFYALNPAKHL